jgi:hypothetical protein
MTLSERELLLQLDYENQRRPILSPPGDRAYAALLVDRVGGIQSGERLTSFKGTTINSVRIQAKMRRLGIRGDYTNFGDDMTISANDPKLRDKWLSLPDWLGFEEEVAPDLSFLMKRIPYGYAYLGRMLSSTINKEVRREPASVTQAAAGIAVRHFLLEGHPLQSQYKVILRRHGTPRIQMALALADAASPRDLLLWSMLGRFTIADGERAEALSELVSDLTHEPQLESVRSAMMERYQMSFGEFLDTVSQISLHDAERAIQKRAYTRRTS